MFGAFGTETHDFSYQLQDPVQADETGPSVDALRTQVTAFVRGRSIDAAELEAVRSGSIKLSPGLTKSSTTVLNAIAKNDELRRPDDNVVSLPQRYDAMTLGQVRAAVRGELDPARTIWVVVGDAKIVRPKIEGLGLPVQVLPASAVADGIVDATTAAPATAIAR